MTSAVGTHFRRVFVEIREYASLNWLDRFPGFFDDLAPILHGYAKAIAKASESVESWPKDSFSPDHREALSLLLLCATSANSLGQLSDLHFSWYTRRAMLQLAYQLGRDPTSSDFMVPRHATAASPDSCVSSGVAAPDGASAVPSDASMVSAPSPSKPRAGALLTVCRISFSLLVLTSCLARGRTCQRR